MPAKKIKPGTRAFAEAMKNEPNMGMNPYAKKKSASRKSASRKKK